MKGLRSPQEVLPNANWALIPNHMWEGMARYIDRGIRPGDFLLAVLSNNLSEAAGRADDSNRYALAHYVTFLSSYAPIGCFGSPSAVDEWCASGGLQGMTEGAAA